MDEKLTDAEVQAVLDSAPICFGLAQQGHLPLVKELRAAGHGFNVIGNRIGWDAKTAAEHYCFHLESQAADLRQRLADAEGCLREIALIHLEFVAHWGTRGEQIDYRLIERVASITGIPLMRRTDEAAEQARLLLDQINRAALRAAKGEY